MTDRRRFQTYLEALKADVNVCPVCPDCGTEVYGEVDCAVDWSHREQMWVPPEEPHTYYCHACDWNDSEPVWEELK